MSKIWPHYTKQHPCPICNHHDWACRQGSRSILCMRVQSDHPCQSGGWYHPIGDSKPRPVPLFPPRPSRPPSDFNALMNRLWAKESRILHLAKELGVSPESLESLGAAWWDEEKCWAIPMRDGNESIVGVCRRYRDGSKKFLGNIGLFIPQSEPDREPKIVEGASDTAAMLTMGFYAVGRASCNTGAEMLKVLLQRKRIGRVVVVSDADGIKQTGNRPGYVGAVQLQKMLGVPSVRYLPPPPIKDVRQLLQRLGPVDAKEIIQSTIAEKVWSRV